MGPGLADELVDLGELRHPRAVELQAVGRGAPLDHGAGGVERREVLTDLAPDLVLLLGIGDERRRRTFAMVGGELGDRVPTRAVDRVAEARIVGIQRDQLVGIGGWLLL